MERSITSYTLKKPVSVHKIESEFESMGLNIYQSLDEEEVDIITSVHLIVCPESIGILKRGKEHSNNKKDYYYYNQTFLHINSSGVAATYFDFTNAVEPEVHQNHQTRQLAVDIQHAAFQAIFEYFKTNY